MSSEKNSRRVNLSFRLSSPDQHKAYSILRGVENKTEFITHLILTNENVEYEKKGTPTKDLIREVLAEILPTLQTNTTQPVARGIPSLAADTEDKAIAKEEIAADHSAEEKDAEKNQYPLDADTDPEATDYSEGLDFEVSDDFLSSIEGLMKAKENHDLFTSDGEGSTD